tara:strand:- start:1049 stop:2569 length:1521 start_codon:yes stop_codon:yes gene_type:complete
MATEKTIKIKADVGEAISSVDELKNEVQATDQAADAASASFGTLNTSVTAVGTSLKAIGIGLIVAAFVQLKEILGRNQVVMDTVTTATEAVNFIFQKLIDSAIDLGSTIIKAFQDPQQAVINLWNTIKQNIADRINGLIDTFGALGNVIRSAFSRDLAGLKQGLSDAKTGFVQMATGMTAVEQSNFSKNLQEQTDQLIKNIKAAGDYGAAITRLRNEVKLAEAEQRRLIVTSQKEAEIQRQVRDNVNLTLEERIAANNRLGEILTEQSIKEEELAQKRIALAQLESDQNQKNVDLKVALQDAETALVEIQERIVSQRSEQLQNLTALQNEYNDSIEETAEVSRETGEVEVAITELTAENKRQIIANSLGQVADLVGRQTAAGKALAIGQALINTYSAATAALSPPPVGAGPVWGIPVAAGAVLAGLANVHKIISTKLPGVSDDPAPTGGEPSVPSGVGGIGGTIPNMESIQGFDTPETPPVQAFVVENAISSAQALQDELEIQATL